MPKSFLFPQCEAADSNLRWSGASREPRSAAASAGLRIPVWCGMGESPPVPNGTFGRGTLIHAGYRNRTGNYSLENCCFATKLIPPVGAPRIGLGLPAPKAGVLPVYYAPWAQIYHEIKALTPKGQYFRTALPSPSWSKSPSRHKPDRSATPPFLAPCGPAGRSAPPYGAA